MKGNPSESLRALLTGLVLLWGSWGWSGPATSDDDDDGGVAMSVADSVAAAAADVQTPDLQPDPSLMATGWLAAVIPHTQAAGPDLLSQGEPSSRPPRVALCRSNR